MVKRYFQCTFLSDIVLNAHTATEGKSMTLDYVPGSAFLGIVARNYGQFAEKAFDIFHSGKVRFSDAHPAVQNARSLKMPCAWFYKKSDSYDEKGKLEPQKIFVYHKTCNRQDMQLKQIRSGFFMENRTVCDVKHSFSLKSAYNLEKRRAADSQMYGYDALARGSRWIFSIEFDDPAVAESVCSRITGRHSIGRSRSSQYGQVEIEAISNVPEVKLYDKISDNRITLYAESCLAFDDQYGQPTFEPDSKSLMLPAGAKIVWQESQIRTKVFAPWNRTMKTRDMDRVCLDKGSVLVIHVPAWFDEKSLQAYRESVKAGVGLYRSEGMGKILVNPQFLEATNEAHPKLEMTTEQSKETQTEAIYSAVESDTSDQVILNWIQDKVASENKNMQVMKAVSDFIKQNREDYKKITPSQWGAVREKVTGACNYSQMIDVLFKEPEKKDGVKKKNDPNSGFLMHGKSEKDWKERGRRDTLEQAIKKVEKDVGEKYARIFVIKLCSEMAKHVSEKKGGRK